MDKEHYVYKYVWNGDRVIYIGLTDHNLPARIQCHEKQKEFEKYLSDCTIYCARLANKAETDVMETALINKYKPIINIQKKYPQPCSIQFEEPQWELYSSYLARRTQNAGKASSAKEATRIKQGIAQSKHWISKFERELEMERALLRRVDTVYEFLVAHNIDTTYIYVEPYVYPTEAEARESLKVSMPVISFSYNKGWLGRLLFSRHDIQQCRDGFCVVYYFNHEGMEDYDQYGNEMAGSEIPAVQFFVKHYRNIRGEYQQKVSQLEYKLEKRRAALQGYLERESLASTDG